MNVIFGDDRQIEVDHQRQVFDVQTTGGDVGRDQNLHFAQLETVQCALARGLRFVAMDAVSIHTEALKFFHQRIDAVTRLGEHQHLLPLVLAHQVHEQFGLAFLVHSHDPLLDRVGGDIARADFDAQRIVEHLPGEQADVIGEGCGKQ